MAGVDMGVFATPVDSPDIGPVAVPSCSSHRQDHSLCLLDIIPP